MPDIVSGVAWKFHSSHKPFWGLYLGASYEVARYPPEIRPRQTSLSAYPQFAARFSQLITFEL
jgi:hypothetical protein